MTIGLNWLILSGAIWLKIAKKLKNKHSKQTNLQAAYQSQKLWIEELWVLILVSSQDRHQTFSEGLYLSSMCLSLFGNESKVNAAVAHSNKKWQVNDMGSIEAQSKIGYTPGQRCWSPSPILGRKVDQHPRLGAMQKFCEELRAASKLVHRNFLTR